MSMTVHGRENLHVHARSCHGIFCIPKFGDSGGDTVIDAEGHRAVGYCLVPKHGFNK